MADSRSLWRRFRDRFRSSDADRHTRRLNLSAPSDVLPQSELKPEASSFPPGLGSGGRPSSGVDSIEESRREFLETPEAKHTTKADMKVLMPIPQRTHRLNLDIDFDSPEPRVFLDTAEAKHTIKANVDVLMPIPQRPYTKKLDLGGEFDSFEPPPTPVIADRDQDLNPMQSLNDRLDWLESNLSQSVAPLNNILYSNLYSSDKNFSNTGWQRRIQEEYPPEGSKEGPINFSTGNQHPAGRHDVSGMTAGTPPLSPSAALASFQFGFENKPVIPLQARRAASMQNDDKPLPPLLDRQAKLEVEHRNISDIVSGLNQELTKLEATKKAIAEIRRERGFIITASEGDRSAGSEFAVSPAAQSSSTPASTRATTLNSGGESAGHKPTLTMPRVHDARPRPQGGRD